MPVAPPNHGGEPPPRVGQRECEARVFADAQSGHGLAGQSGVSVVIPARDEEDSILGTMDALLGQTLQPNEILLVDAGSRDRTVQRVRDVGARAPMKVRCESIGPAFPGVARNWGLERAGCPLVAFLDAGTGIEANWLEALVSPFANRPGVDVVFGTYEPWVQTRLQALVATLVANKRTQVDGRPFRAATTAAMAIRKSAVHRVGGFPPHLRAAEDLVFKERLNTMSASVALAPDCVAKWRMPSSVRAVFAKYATYSRYVLHAGLWRTWHRQVIRYHLFLLLLLAVLLAAKFPAQVGGVCIALFLGVRAARHALVKPEFLGSGTRAFLALPELAGVVVLMDLALVSGLLLWACDKARGTPAGSRS